MTDKVSKASVHYRKGSKQEHCSICTMYIAPTYGRGARCTLVDGVIYAKDTCDRFELDKKKKP